LFLIPMSDIRIDQLIRSRRRSIGIEIAGDARLIVRAPKRISQKEIEHIVAQKRSWIREKQNAAKIHQQQFPPKTFVDGESFYYLGKTYPLKLFDGPEIRLSESLEFPRTFLPDARRHLKEWYKAKACRTMKERVDWYSQVTGLSYARIKISDARQRLGSCSFKGNLNFSWRLMMAPLEIVDYIVVHELVHLVERNHSRPFWQKVGVVLPDYREKEYFLRKNPRLFDFP
jgi:predicted metal-dependent hydrolase